MKYKRLTIRNSDGSVSQPTHSTFEKVFNRLAEIEDKMEQGLMIEVPCKVGDSFYGVATNAIFEYSVFAIKIVENNAIHLTAIYDIDFVLGKDCFLTKAEAEAKLKELQNG